MSSPLLLVSPRSHKSPIRVSDLVHLLSATYLDQIEREIRYIRETFRCPPTVPDHEEFRREIFRFHLHYETAIRTPNKVGVTSPEGSFEFLRRHLKGDLHTVERNAIMGRDGGFLRVVDDMTDSLVKMHQEHYVDM